ncbi:hypothetical protein NPIL_681701 [Nephila pilipes]|uniref:Uncharacterized protein n=1 Tax=Nephila pilipes TaxID=299642 RepID=A0A8X6U7Q1_NEPPI|nr:hypothetical protein NPIL_681701 [Nephila pilipes]
MIYITQTARKPSGDSNYIPSKWLLPRATACRSASHFFEPIERGQAGSRDGHASLVQMPNRKQIPLWDSCVIGIEVAVITEADFKLGLAFEKKKREKKSGQPNERDEHFSNFVHVTGRKEKKNLNPDSSSKQTVAAYERQMADMPIHHSPRRKRVLKNMRAKRPMSKTAAVVAHQMADFCEDGTQKLVP